MRKNKDGYTLSSGREIRPNLGILGLERDEGGTLRVTEGYDSTLREDEPDYINDKPRREDALTTAERKEIADYMVALWQEWAAQA